jgi:hypothetical protein
VTSNRNKSVCFSERIFIHFSARLHALWPKMRGADDSALGVHAYPRLLIFERQRHSWKTVRKKQI